MTLRKPTTGFLAFAAALLTCSSVSALDFDERTRLHNRSVFAGVGAPEVALLSRERGPGADAVLATLQTRLQTGGLISGDSTEERSTTERTLHGNGWRLSVSNDGTRIRFRNRAVLEDNRRQGRTTAVDDRMTNDELEARGRAFLREQLSEIVVLDAGEALVPLFTEHEIDSVLGEHGKLAPDSVAASTVVFGRTVDGIHVIGAGSKLAILFAPDGQPVGFDADWPRYRKLGPKQRLLDIDSLRERASALGARKVGNQGVGLKRFECGYVDRGATNGRRDEAAPIQAGCQASYHGREVRAGEAGGELIATSSLVPAGQLVEPDAAWPEAHAVCEGGDVCRDSSLGQALRFSSAPRDP